MRRVAFALLGLALAACGEREPAVGDCASAVVVGGQARLGVHVADRPGPWPAVDRRVDATAPGCGDEGGQAVRLIQFQGVAAEVALAQESADTGTPYTLYPSDAFFLQVRSHPLHDALYGTRAPDEARGQRCRSRPDRTGRVSEIDGRSGTLTLQGVAPWLIDFRTIVRAPLWHGVPQTRVGQQVRVGWVVCGRTRRVARRIETVA
jgi:hypothetical protein